MARRLPAQALQTRARRALLALCLWPALAGATQPWENEPLVSARYAEPTARYPHAALGDEIEYAALELQYLPGQLRYVIRLPESRVFEDVAPRLVDVDQDGRAEALVVESDQRLGARLALYNGGGLMAATPFIGQRFRWLAPLGAADLDGDGLVELAYVDRPHLAKVLRVWRFKDGALHEVADLPGFTNHGLGERDIAGGIRTCAGQPEMIVADAGWRDLYAVTLTPDARLRARKIAPRTTRAAFAQAMRCE